MKTLFLWFLSMLLSFGAGAKVGREYEPDTELEQKVQEHMDVIVDESAAIVDDVVEEIRKDERVQDAEKFIDDVNEIVDNTKQDIHDHFGKEAETEAVPEEALEEATEESTETAAE